MQVKTTDNKILVKTEYNPQMLYLIRQIPERKWNPISRVWELPLNETSLTQLKEKFNYDTTELKESYSTQYLLLHKKLQTRHPFLFQHQLEGATKAILAKKLLIADACGTGKTLLASSVANHLFYEGTIQRALIICPHSIKWQWKREIEKYFLLEVNIVEGQPKQRKEMYGNYRINIINYEQLLRDFNEINNFSRDQLIIFDEATYVKNSKAKRTKLLKHLKPKYIFGLSGTPIETKLEDVFTICNIIKPNWMTKTEFFGNYCIFTQVFGHAQISGYRNVDVFMKRVYEMTIRRKLEDVANMIPKAIYNRFVELTAYQKKLVGQILKKIKDDYRNGVSNSLIQKFVLLQMAENYTQLIKDSRAMSLRDIEVEKIESAKINELNLILQEMSGIGKIVIFTKFSRMAEHLVELLSDSVLGTSGTDKRATINTFKNEKRFLVATDAYAYGVDLPFVDTIINFDVPWNPARIQQRIDRCYRLSSKQQLKVFNLVSTGFEKYIYDKMSERKDLGERFDARRFIEEYCEKYIL